MFRESSNNGANAILAGRQDAMQRQSLVPLKSWMDKRGSIDGSGLSFLEVAGGTGRFATFVKVSFEPLNNLLFTKRYKAVASLRKAVRLYAKLNDFTNVDGAFTASRSIPRSFRLNQESSFGVTFELDVLIKDANRTTTLGLLSPSWSSVPSTCKRLERIWTTGRE